MATQIRVTRMVENPPKSTNDPGSVILGLVLDNGTDSVYREVVTDEATAKHYFSLKTDQGKYGVMQTLAKKQLPKMVADWEASLAGPRIREVVGTDLETAAGGDTTISVTPAAVKKAAAKDE